MWCGFADQAQLKLILSETPQQHPESTTMNQALVETCATLGITPEEGVRRKRKSLGNITENRSGIAKGDEPTNEDVTPRDYLFFLVYRFHYAKKQASVSQWEVLHGANEAGYPWGRVAQMAIFQLLETNKPTASCMRPRANRQQTLDVMAKRDTETSMPAAT